MSNSESFRDYPKILKIEDDGKIIALDKHGKINTDSNMIASYVLNWIKNKGEILCIQ